MVVFALEVLVMLFGSWFERKNLKWIQSDMCRKLIYNRKIEVVKLGTKNFIARAEVIRYLKSRTISAVNSTEKQK
jgi:hypothetical protein